MAIPVAALAGISAPPVLSAAAQASAMMGGSSAGAAGAAGAGAAGMSLAGLVGVVTKLSPVIFTVTKAMQALNGQITESRRQFAQYNGTIAVAFAKLDVGRIHRDIGMGRATSASTAELVDSTNRKEQAMQPLNAALTNIGNSFGDAINEAAIFILDNGITPILKLMPGYKEPKPEQDATALQILLGRMPRGNGGWHGGNGPEPFGATAFREGIQAQQIANEARRHGPIDKHTYELDKLARAGAYAVGKAARREAYRKRFS